MEEGEGADVLLTWSRELEGLPPRRKRSWVPKIFPSASLVVLKSLVVTFWSLVTRYWSLGHLSLTVVSGFFFQSECKQKCLQPASKYRLPIGSRISSNKGRSRDLVLASDWPFFQLQAFWKRVCLPCPFRPKLPACSLPARLLPGFLQGQSAVT